MRSVGFSGLPSRSSWWRSDRDYPRSPFTRWSEIGLFRQVSRLYSDAANYSDIRRERPHHCATAQSDDLAPPGYNDRSFVKADTMSGLDGRRLAIAALQTTWYLATAACGGLRSAHDCRPRTALLHHSHSWASPIRRRRFRVTRSKGDFAEQPATNPRLSWLLCTTRASAAGSTTTATFTRRSCIQP
jgi:hypothetical protein